MKRRHFKAPEMHEYTTKEKLKVVAGAAAAVAIDSRALSWTGSVCLSGASASLPGPSGQNRLIAQGESSGSS
jgi:hypothetical protein